MAFTSDKTRQGAAGAGGYTINNSLRFEDGDAAYLSRTPTTAGNRKTWTWSGWVKRSNLGIYTDFMISSNSGNGQNRTYCYFSSSDDLVFGDYTSVWQSLIGTTQRFRDTSAWYHIIIAYDTTQSTNANRLKLYVNGQQVTDFTSETYPSQNYEGYTNNTNEHTIGYLGYSGDRYADMHLAEVNFIDGQALTPADFGETGDYGEWKPIKYTGTYGTNGFYLDFKNSGSLGNDANGSNNWTPNNLAATDQMIDTPTNNFATWNALFEGGESSSSIYADTTLSEGNLKASVPTNSYMGATIRPKSGAWYSEFLVSTVTGEVGWGWLNAPDYSYNTANAGVANKWGGYYLGSSSALKVYDETSQLGSDIALTISNGDILQLAWDIDNSKGYIGINDTWYAADNGTDGNPSAGTNQTFTFTATEATNLQPYVANGTSTAVFVANFGQDSSFAGNKTAQGNQGSNGVGDFYYAPPTGFLALCSANLPVPDVIPSEHFNTVAYSGDGTDRNIDVGFKSDFVWLKQRSGANAPRIYDSIRGAGVVFSSLTNAEWSGAGDGIELTYNDGFNIDVGANVLGYNGSGHTYVAWNWKANGSGSSNTNGSITSTVSANVDAGFSIVSYTGTSTLGTIGHGLALKPQLVIYKSRDSAKGWLTYNETITASKYLRLDLTDAEATAASTFNNTEPTSSLLTVNTSTTTNTSPDAYIAYAFHSVDGYSKVGSYTGNGSSDGTFVHCGFRPAYLMFKRTDAASSWFLRDAARDTYNPVNKTLVADTSAAEDSWGGAYPLDFTSNGFKLRTGITSFNASGGTYIYIAFAETPFKYANAR